MSVAHAFLLILFFSYSLAAPNGDRLWSDSYSLTDKSTSDEFERIIDKQLRDNRVMMYTGSTCLMSAAAKSLFDTEYTNWKYKYLDVDITPGAEWLMGPILRRSGTLGLPIIFICGNYIGGQPRLAYMHKTKILEPMLRQC